MRRMSSRYIAGETLESALERLSGLAARGFGGILDVLGEHVEDEAAAREVVRTYGEAADAVADRKLDCYVSVKPTHVGLKISEELCLRNYAELAERCAARRLFLRVEMEDSPTTDGTLRVFERLRERYDNVGIVLQARMLRTPADVDALAPGPLDVRLVKGIYLEPAEIAHVDAEPIRDAYVAIATKLFARGARVALATHDEALAARCLLEIRQKRIPRERYEFQLLLGVREVLAERWRASGHPVRIYVPYGPDWRAYSTRRLKHNPEILSAVMKAAISRR